LDKCDLPVSIIHIWLILGQASQIGRGLSRSVFSEFGE
jgi:hypothetical protein